jgi:hypothetical protein
MSEHTALIALIALVAKAEQLLTGDAGFFQCDIQLTIRSFGPYVTNNIAGIACPRELRTTGHCWRTRLMVPMSMLMPMCLRRGLCEEMAPLGCPQSGGHVGSLRGNRARWHQVEDLRQAFTTLVPSRRQKQGGGSVKADRFWTSFFLERLCTKKASTDEPATMIPKFLDALGGLQTDEAPMGGTCKVFGKGLPNKTEGRVCDAGESSMCLHVFAIEKGNVTCNSTNHQQESRPTLDMRNEDL